MKKTFSLKDPVKKTERVADAIKNEVKKYIKRERNKELPEGVDFWDFDCRIGADSGSTKPVHQKEISSSIDKLVSAEAENFYLEILAKHGFRKKKK